MGARPGRTSGGEGSSVRVPGLEVFSGLTRGGSIGDRSPSRADQCRERSDLSHDVHLF